MNFEQAFLSLGNDRFVTKHSNYFQIYEKHLSDFKGKDRIIVLEIGLLDGGSINLWKNYFGEKLIFHGIDINPRCKKYEEKNVNIHIGSQSDFDFLVEVINKIPDLDVIIDDGGHTMKQQKRSFEVLFPKLSFNGVYICEDTHTSYRYPYGGGLKRKSSFIEYSKTMIDYLHREETPQVKSKDTLKGLNSLHFYDSIIVFDKKNELKREVVTRGEYNGFNADYADVKRGKVYYIFHKWVNVFLSKFNHNGYSYVFGPDKD